ncbi:MAG: FAD-binding oxidoreductase, partial [Hyphomicrobiales bacterium]|nr:FAD-binding oxidoreductase [Hyphomicrobiales bacterium]
MATHRYDPPSWYADTAGKRDDYPALDDDINADVCIVGGGYAGLSAALHLAERGIDTVLLEAERVGYGASGRNGGQIHSGQRRDQDWLEERFGLDTARRLWSAGEEAKALVADLISRHDIDCELRYGLIHAVHKPRYVDDERRSMERLVETYGYDKLDWLDRSQLAEALGTDVYHAGVRDRGAGHLHPLKFAIGLARAARKAGVRIFEASPATMLEQRAGPTVRTARGSVSAGTVVLAGNGYIDGIDSDLETRVLPINNYILATEPIGAGAAGGILPGGDAASDSRFVIYYWRPSPDGRLLFGGGE